MLEPLKRKGTVELSPIESILGSTTPQKREVEGDAEEEKGT